MTIIRVRSSEFFSMVRDKLLQYEVVDQTEYIKYLCLAFEQNPDLFFIVAAIEGAEIVAFLVAFVAPEKSYVFIMHAWAKPGIPEHVTKIGFLEVSTWAKLLGRDEVRAETRRDAEAFYRRWGFEQIATVMGYKVNKQEVEDGRRISTKIDVDVVRQPEGSGRGTGETAEGTVQSGRDTDSAEGLQGTDRSVVAGRVRYDAEADRQLQPESVLSGDRERSQQSAEREASVQPGPSNDGEVLYGQCDQSDVADVSAKDPTTD